MKGIKLREANRGYPGKPRWVSNCIPCGGMTRTDSGTSRSSLSFRYGGRMQRGRDSRTPKNLRAFYIEVKQSNGCDP